MTEVGVDRVHEVAAEPIRGLRSPIMNDILPWQSRWDDGRIGFHQGEVHPDLVDHRDWFLGDSHRVLVPLCGKTIDIPWLADLGHEVIGVEFVEDAITQFFAEQNLTPQVSERSNVTCYRTDKITMLRADFFDVDSADVGAVDRVWDRGALVALEPEIRGPYTAAIRQFAPGGRLLQNSFTYDQSLMAGPPFSVPKAEIEGHYDGCGIEVLGEDDKIAEFPQFQEAGHRYWLTTTYGIQL